MTDRPAPLTAPGTDLRDFGFMPLDVVRLRDSDLASAPDAVFRVAVLLWCIAWHQVPAASLPDDDAVIARMLGFGRDLKGWKRIREAGGLRGWVLCSDGRLYHPVVAQKANEAWQAKRAQRSRTEAARAAREAQRLIQSQGQPHSLLQTQPQSPRDRDRDSKGTGIGIPTDPGDLFTGAPKPSIDATRRVPVSDLDHLSNAHAIIGRDEQGKWQLLVETHGRDRVIDACRQTHLTGERVFYSTIRDLLATWKAGPPARPAVPRPTYTPLQAAERIVDRDGWEACRARLPAWCQHPVVDEKTLLDVLSASGDAVAALVAQSKAIA